MAFEAPNHALHSDGNSLRSIATGEGHVRFKIMFKRKSEEEIVETKKKLRRRAWLPYAPLK